MRCDLIPFFESNYLFALTSSRSSGTVTLIDPGCFATADHYLATSGLRLEAVLLTHHHHDHIGGVDLLRRRHHCAIYGYASDRERLPELTGVMSEGSEIIVCGETAKVMFLPGHTTGLIAYYFHERGALFSGDCIFAMGCGRMFEGTPEQFHTSLRRIAALPPATLIYCAHDYAEANAEFCADVFPEKREFYESERSKAASAKEERSPAIPLQLNEELKRNPFLNAVDPQDFAELRAKRNQFIPRNSV